MKTLQEIKDAKQQKVDTLIKECGVFFAFSNEQFHKHKTPLEEGEKYVDMGSGGFLPKGKVDKWIKGMEDIEQWFKNETKSAKKRRELIAYELTNYECYYTGSISDALEALGEGYTAEEVWTVYNTERKKQATY